MPELNVEPMVWLDTLEAHRWEHRVKGLVPDPACLLQAIEQLYKLADMIWTSHFKSLWLHHVNLLFKSAIEIGMRDINGVKLKVLQGCQGQNNVNGGVANSGGKSLSEIKARLLRIVCLTFMNHLEPVACFPGGSLMTCQVPLTLWASISSSQAFFHSSASEHCWDCL